MSIDGYLATATEKRLLLSNDADFDRVDAVRAASDAILVGAATVRKDNPRLLVRTQARRDERVAKGLTPSPIKVTVTRQAQLDECANFFAAGDNEKLVYCASGALAQARKRFGHVSTVVDGGRRVDMHEVTEDLYARGVQRLMVEGGGADQDRVASGPDGVNPVEVGVVGEQQPLLRRSGEIAVDGHAAAQQRVRAVSHARRLAG